MKQFYILLGITFSVMLFSSREVKAQADDLMIVDYVDWNPGNGVGTTIYNPTADSIDLSKYDIAYYNNGSTTASSTQTLSGKLAPNASAVIGNTDYCTNYCSCNFTNSSAGVNGNDVVAILKNGNFIDMVGLVGSNTFWTVAGTSSALLHHRITRNSNNCTRYTSTSGSSANSWPNNTSTSMTGWSVSSYSCLSSSSFSLSVPSILHPAKDTTICVGTTVTLSASTSTTWARKNGSLTSYSASKTLKITFSKAGTDTFIVGTGSCADSLFISIKPLPAPAIKGNKKLSLCAKGKDTSFIVQNIIGKPQWKQIGSHTGTVIKGSSTKDTLTVTMGIKTGKDTFVVADVSNPCIGYDTLYLTINPAPAPKIKGNKKPAMCASGKDTSFIVQNTIGKPSWRQLTNNTGSVIKGSNTHDTLLVTSGIKTGTDAFVIQDLSGSCTGFDTLYLTINPTPAPKIKGNKKPAMCASGKDTAIIVQNTIGIATWKQLSHHTGSVIKGSLNKDTVIISTGLTVGKDTFLISDAKNTCTGRDTFYLTINPAPAPKINGNKKPSICSSGKDTLFIAKNFIGTPAWKKIGIHTGSFIKTALNHDSITVTLGTKTGTDTFVVVDKSGICSGTDTIYLSIVQAPAPKIKGNKKPGMCTTGKDTVFRILSKTGSVSWKQISSHTGSSIKGSLNNDSIVVSTGTKGGKDTFVVTDKNGSCMGTDTVYLTIYSKPAPRLKGGIRILNLCMGAKDTFCVVQNITGSATWKTISSQTGTTTKASGKGDSLYIHPGTIAGKDVFVIQDKISQCTGYDTLIINILSKPVVNGFKDTTICNGDSVKLSKTGGNTYSWTPVTNIDNPNISNPNVYPKITTKYKVTVSTGGQCQATDSVWVNVKPPVIINAGADKTICAGDSVQFNTTGAVSYTWSPTTGLDHTNIANPWAKPIFTTSYMVKGFSGKCFGKDTIVVKVVPAPVAFAGQDLSVCSGSSIVLTAQVATHYKWSTGETTQSIKVTPTKTTKYVLSVDNGVCTSKNDTIQVSIIPRPKASFFADSIIGYAPHHINFYNSSNLSGNTVRWDFGDGNGSDKISPDHIYAKAGKYAVKMVLTNTNGCEDSIFYKYITVENPPFIYYIPNVFSPNGDGHNDSFAVEGTGIGSVNGQIYNRWGEMIYSFNVPGDKWWDGTFHGDRVPDGVYFYVFTLKDISGNKYYASGPFTILR